MTNKFALIFLLLGSEFTTYQAFYDYENVSVVERLPWYVAGGADRFYPDAVNVEVVKNLLQDEIEYIAFAQKTAIDIEPLIPSTTPRALSENRKFSVWRLDD